MQYTFVHISDIHYRDSWAEEVGVVTGAFFEDLGRQVADVHDPYLVVSGDILAAGGSDQVAQAFIDDFSARLDAVGLPVSRRICVPGNHDVSRDAIKRKLKLRRGSIEALKGESEFNDALADLQDLYLGAGFSSYFKIEQVFASMGCGPETLGGSGHDIGDGLSVYCLNTALTSCCGLPDAAGQPIDDRRRLHVDTRSMYKWLNGPPKWRMLVMHHPSQWLVDWASEEIENAIRRQVALCLMGHTHLPSSEYSVRGSSGVVQCVAPALFTRKNEDLGYAIISVDTDERRITVRYRQWSRNAGVFVLGTVFAGNDSGLVDYSLSDSNVATLPSKAATEGSSTLDALQLEYEDSNICYASKRCLWVGRDLSEVPETAANRNNVVKLSEEDLIRELRSCVIRAPAQYGLSALARRMALQHHRASDDGSVLLVVSAAQLTPADRSLRKSVHNRCVVLKATASKIAGFIFDDWTNDKHSVRVVKALKRIYPDATIVIMSRVEDCSRMDNTLRVDQDLELQNLYLWALDRVRIRQLTDLYIGESGELDVDLVAPRLVSDLTALNIHRTPMNCLLLLRCLEERFDDTPVNRTSMIERVLFGLFHQFDQIPRYASRPDVKDCEFALGYLCEALIRGQRDTFTKEWFMTTVQRYSKERLIDLEVDVLFNILVSEGVVSPRGGELAFRFAYWLHFFAAHRMHHDQPFADWVLSDRRYAAFPELMEFYAGIDRQRADAVRQLAGDLAIMNREFLDRTQIDPEFDPFLLARWEPGDEDLERMRKQVHGAANNSTLPVQVKEDIADRNYDRARPYSQELAEFLEHSSLQQLTSAMRGGARTLRNSDYVAPEDKSRLLDEVMQCWVHVCQVLAVISPVLAKQHRAVFENTHFYLTDGFHKDDVRKRWQQVMDCITDNVVDWYEEDLFSKKMGPLLSRYVCSEEAKLARFLVLLVMIRRRPQGWIRAVKDFIINEDRHSFYMAQIYETLIREYRNGFASEKERQHLLSISAIAVAKHQLNVKNPNQRTIERVARSIEKGETD